MANLALFTIKNEDFNYSAYGLTTNTFVVDITTSLQSSKGVKFTEYPLLDGTTRIDTVSRAPGTINFVGKIGEVYHQPNSDAPRLQAGLDEEQTRIKRFVRLLEALRDDAIVLDLSTEAKLFENYIIESVGIGVSQYGIADVQFSMKEFIAFGTEISRIDFQAGEYTQATQNEFYLNTLTMRNFSTDQELLDSVYELLTNASISEPYMIKMGTSDLGFNPDVFIGRFKVDKPTHVVRYKNNWFTTDAFRTYTPTFVKYDVPTAVYSTGNVVGNYNLKITLPTIEGGKSLVEEDSIYTTSTEPLFVLSYKYKSDEFSETGKYPIKIELYKDNTLLDTIVRDDLYLTPKYSEVAGGVNPLNPITGVFEPDLILTNNNNNIYKNIVTFLKKTKDSKVYQMAPNLLKDTSYGYLYCFKYLREYGNDTQYHLGFIYFHPELVKRLETIINNFNITTSNLLYNKTVKWW